MAEKTGIQWTTSTWNPLGARNTLTGKKGWFCTRVSEGCRNCYAEAVNRRVGNGLEYTAQNERNVEWYLKALTDPLKWKDGRYIFTNSMTDIFHKDVPFEFMDEIYAVMALSPRHTYQNLTKRPEIRRQYLSTPGVEIRVFTKAREIAKRFPQTGTTYPLVWPLPNVWEGISIAEQKDADRDIPILLNTPAALRWVSYEPAIGLVDFRNFLKHPSMPDRIVKPGSVPVSYIPVIGLDWIVVGGESGPRARPFSISWAHETVRECHACGVPVFVKQMGANPVTAHGYKLHYADHKGGDMDEWLHDLRVREMPEVRR